MACKIRVEIRWKVLLTLAIVAIVGFTIMQIPAVNVFVYRQYCAAWYERNHWVLESELPSMQAHDGETYLLMVTHGQAFLQRTENGLCIDFPLKDYGDFYQRTYRFGVVWAEDREALINKNPNVEFHELGNGWLSYISVEKQNGPERR